MSILTRLRALFARKPPTQEELQARAEAQRLRDEVETARLSQRSQAGENYQSFGGPGT